MSTRRERLSEPRAYLAAGGAWPDGPFMEAAPNEVEFIATLVRHLTASIAAARDAEGTDVAALAVAADLSAATVYSLLAGRSWGEARTIFRLETALQRPLWHRDHIAQGD